MSTHESDCKAHILDWTRLSALNTVMWSIFLKLNARTKSKTQSWNWVFLQTLGNMAGSPSLGSCHKPPSSLRPGS